MFDPKRLPRRPLTRCDLLALALNDRDIARLVRDGHLRRVLRGVYLLTDVEDTLSTRTACVELVTADNHVVVDRTAAWLHGVDVLSYSEHEVLPPVETCALRGNHPTERHDVRGRSRELAPRDVMLLDGLRVTTPLRTALDLGCHLRRREAMAALNAFARRHALSRTMLARELPRFRGRRGVIQLRELVSYVNPWLESERETWVWLEIRDTGLPLPEAQHWIHIEGVPTYRLDFAYVRARICVEYDGADAHDRSEEQRRYDRDRRAWLRENGWTVIVVKAGDFSGDGLDRWIRELRTALEATYSTRRW